MLDDKETDIEFWQQQDREYFEHAEQDSPESLLDRLDVETDLAIADAETDAAIRADKRAQRAGASGEPTPLTPEQLQEQHESECLSRLRRPFPRVNSCGFSQAEVRTAGLLDCDRCRPGYGVHSSEAAEFFARLPLNPPDPQECHETAHEKVFVELVTQGLETPGRDDCGNMCWQGFKCRPGHGIHAPHLQEAIGNAMRHRQAEQEWHQRNRRVAEARGESYVPIIDGPFRGDLGDEWPYFKPEPPLKTEPEKINADISAEELVNRISVLKAKLRTEYAADGQAQTEHSENKSTASSFVAERKRV